MRTWKNRGPDRCSYGSCRREPESAWLPGATTLNPRTTLQACGQHEHLLCRAAHDRRRKPAPVEPKTEQLPLQLSFVSQ